MYASRERGIVACHQALEPVWIKLVNHFTADRHRTRRCCGRRSRTRSPAAVVSVFRRLRARRSCGSAIEREKLSSRASSSQSCSSSERTRASFTVEEASRRAAKSASLAGQFELRIDRIDSIEGGGYAILDYKSASRARRAGRAKRCAIRSCWRT